MSHLQIEQRSHILTITLNRPEALNALNRDLLLELSTALDTASDTIKRDPSQLRVVLLRGAGEKAFVAGADIKGMQAASPAALREFIELGEHVMRQLELLPVPVLSIVNGFALGGGMELAMSCDLIIATERAKFGQPEVNLGIIPGFGGTQRLMRRAGVGAAKRLVFTGETINGEEAYRLGIADYYIPSGELEGRLEKLCNSLIEKGPQALAASKRAIESGENAPKVMALQEEKEEFLKVFRTEDAAEGLTAFLEKRKAQFQGR